MSNYTKHQKHYEHLCSLVKNGVGVVTALDRVADCYDLSEFDKEHLIERYDEEHPNE